MDLWRSQVRRRTHIATVSGLWITGINFPRRALSSSELPTSTLDREWVRPESRTLGGGWRPSNGLISLASRSVKRTNNHKFPSLGLRKLLSLSLAAAIQLHCVTLQQWKEKKLSNYNLTIWRQKNQTIDTTRCEFLSRILTNKVENSSDLIFWSKNIQKLKWVIGTCVSTDWIGLDRIFNNGIYIQTHHTMTAVLIKTENGFHTLAQFVTSSLDQKIANYRKLLDIGRSNGRKLTFSDVYLLQFLLRSKEPALQ